MGGDFVEEGHCFRAVEKHATHDFAEDAFCDAGDACVVEQGHAVGARRAEEVLGEPAHKTALGETGRGFDHFQTAMDSACLVLPSAACCQELLKREDSSGRCAAVAAFVAYILDTDKPRQTAAVVAWCSGMSLLEGKSAVEMAAEFGVSKQAWCALAGDLCDKLGISPPRSIRSELGREEMSKSHFKRRKV